MATTRRLQFAIRAKVNYPFPRPGTPGRLLSDDEYKSQFARTKATLPSFYPALPVADASVLQESKSFASCEQFWRVRSREAYGVLGEVETVFGIWVEPLFVLMV